MNTSSFTPPIKLMIFDVDGIFTDGSLHVSEAGEIIKTFHTQDGMGITLLHKASIKTAIISGRQSATLTYRANELGLTHVFQGIEDKYKTFLELLSLTQCTPEECGYMGDDINDLPVLLRVGFSASTPDAHPEVINRVQHITQKPGGRGAVREVCDLILKKQGQYDALLAAYLK
jgi:3-deoxy-D-manno-octulosonate 8-phosphate phosphatase (KDO 8-P phosphatase)